MAKAGNILRKKLYRDMSRAAMQFLSIIVLCMIGSFAFSALDGTARMMKTTVEVYFEENNLADFWVTLPVADRAALNKLASLDGVDELCARATRDLESTLGDDVTVCVTKQHRIKAIFMAFPKIACSVLYFTSAASENPMRGS